MGPPTVQGYSEDCLALDVLVPSSPASDSLAVLVQIHGGGYTLGNAETYPGDALVHASAGKLIYVSMQYRLALFGFLGGSEIAGNGVQNAGLLDQRAALDWVQRNIRAFGGDPSQVTIWGGSAGGGSVSYQLLANGAADDPPFSAAIAEYPWWQPLLDDEIQEKQYSTALRVAGCADLSCLRALPAETLQQVNQGTANASYPGPGFGYGLWGYGPVVDGVFLRDLPDAEFKRGNFHKVPLIVDHDAFEGVIFSNMTETTVMDETMDVSLLFWEGNIEVADQRERLNTSFRVPRPPSSPGYTSCIRRPLLTRHSSSGRLGSETSSLIVSLHPRLLDSIPPF